MSDNDIRTITQMLYELSERIARIEEKLSIIPLCGANCSQGKLKELERRLGELEEEKKWLYRTVIGSVLVAVMALIKSFA